MYSAEGDRSAIAWQRLSMVKEWWPPPSNGYLHVYANSMPSPDDAVLTGCRRSVRLVADMKVFPHQMGGVIVLWADLAAV